MFFQGSMTILYIKNYFPTPFWKSYFFPSADKIWGVVLFHFPFNLPKLWVIFFPFRSLGTVPKIMHTGTIYLSHCWLHFNYLLWTIMLYRYSPHTFGYFTSYICSFLLFTVIFYIFFCHSFLSLINPTVQYIRWKKCTGTAQNLFFNFIFSSLFLFFIFLLLPAPYLPDIGLFYFLIKAEFPLHP